MIVEVIETLYSMLPPPGFKAVIRAVEFYVLCEIVYFLVLGVVMEITYFRHCLKTKEKFNLLEGLRLWTAVEVDRYK